MSQKILIIEDSTDINNLVTEALAKNGYSCTQAFSGTEGLSRIHDDSFSLVILDLMLPGMAGEKLLPVICERHIPVIVLSAKDSLSDRVGLLNAGAEDYMTKPFEIEELITRVKVQLRRLPSQEQDSNILRYRDMALYIDNFSVFVAGQKLPLTRQEFKILEMLLKNPPGRVLSKHNFYEHAWGSDYVGEDKTINVHISNIRKKLKAVTDTEYIETVWGVGFRLIKE